MTSDVALAKLATIERCLQRIATVTGGDPERVDEIDVEEIVVLNLQRAIQASIDLAAHLRAMTGFRNIAVHDYERLDRAVLKGILRERLGDLSAFADAVRAAAGV